MTFLIIINVVWTLFLPRVLHALSSHPQPAVMPVDIAVCLSLSQRQPLYQLLSMAPVKPIQQHSQPSTSLRPQHGSPSSPYPTLSSRAHSPVSSGLRSCFRRDYTSPTKKRVVFADAKGLALTAVRLFVPEPSSTTSTLMMKPSPVNMQGQQSTSNKQQRYKLKLGFPQPSLDIKPFLARLREVHVQLESCSISENSLIGHVCVTHTIMENAVHVRVTFDSWQSYQDIPCTFLQQQRCGSLDVGLFAFDVSIPKNIDPKERIEFCVYYWPGSCLVPFCDDNRGQKYRVCVEKEGSSANPGNPNRCYPTVSHNRMPSWPSYGSLRVKNSAELQYLQRFIKQSQSRAESPVFSWGRLVNSAYNLSF